MKLRSLVLFLVASLLVLAAPRTVRAAEVSFDFFFDSLSPYGEWIELEDYGYSWRPGGVDADWTPYSDGYWSYTDAGWTWVSYEDFGGIVYHYGRWVNTEDDGWCWVPDYEWGPAWVSWRRSDDYVGWAPLPAEALWERNRGISVWVDTSYDIGPRSYNFCRIHDFGAPVLRPVIIRRTENVAIIHNTVNITNITFNTGAGCVFNGGLDYGFMNRQVRRQIPALKLVRNTNVTVVNNTIINNNVRVTNFNAVQRGNQLTVLAPTVVRPQREQIAAIVQPKVTRVVPKQKVTRGWSGVSGEQRENIRAAFAQQTRDLTPETAPAKPMKADDVKVVPKKADPTAKIAAPKIPARPLPGVKPGSTPAIVAQPTDVPPRATPIAPGGVNPKMPTAETTAPGQLDTPTPKGRRPGMASGTPIVAPKKNTAVETTRATPPPIVSQPTNPNPIVKPEPVRPVRPGVTKPFNPNGDEPPAVTRSRATPPPNPALEKRNSAAAAAEAAREKAAAQAEQRQRLLEQSRQRQAVPPPTVRSKPPEPDRTQQIQQQQAARQRMIEQQQQQQQAAAAAKARAAEANEARARALQQQAQTRARQPQLERPPVTRERAVPQPIVRQPAQPPVQRAPAQPVPRGKRPMTPEEAAELQKSR